MVAASVEGQALDIKRTSPRVTAGDLVVLIGAVVLVLAGWGLKTLHDNRTNEVDVGGITVAVPQGWFRLPTVEPELLRAISNTNGRERLILTSQETTQEDLLLLVGSGAGNPAASEVAYTQLTNENSEVDGNPAIQTDYAYVETTVGGATVPTVIRGRQEAWIKDGRIFVLALEAPEDDWDEANDKYDRLIDEVGT
jgi:hypothetical protein